MAATSNLANPVRTPGTLQHTKCETDGNMLQRAGRCVRSEETAACNAAFCVQQCDVPNGTPARSGRYNVGCDVPACGALRHAHCELSAHMLRAQQQSYRLRLPLGRILNCLLSLLRHPDSNPSEQRTTCRGQRRQRAADDERQVAADDGSVGEGAADGRETRARCGAPRGTDLFLLLGRRLLRRDNNASARAGARACVCVCAARACVAPTGAG